MAIAPPDVTDILRKSRTQSLTSAEVSLMPTYASLDEFTLCGHVVKSCGEDGFHFIHINKVLSFAGADSLRTSMRDAFGKPQGTVIRVHIGQVIMSIYTTLQNKEHVIEALCRAKFKFPGYQRIHISKKQDFTKFNEDEFEDTVAEKWLMADSCVVKFVPNQGSQDK
ncbi:60S ribosomal protein L10 [Pteropus alecto]|uniref:60S ribosomal protein L10 n=1 Tax=Pteropus alecto TaxID=9402 RepID=L5JY28_PTEAL|nr:60S ribosomal protein L10 [Pteropus alecto]